MKAIVILLTVVILEKPYCQSTMMAAPNIIEATDGKLEKEVRIYWQSLGVGYEYKVVRSQAATFPPKNFVEMGNGWQVQTHLSDRSVKDGEYYYYFVKARKGSVESPFSAADRGFSLVVATGSLSNKTTPSVSNDSLQASLMVGENSKLGQSQIVGYTIENMRDNATNALDIQLTISKNNEWTVAASTVATESIGNLAGRSVKRGSFKFASRKITAN
jgi:hypothetical protein